MKQGRIYKNEWGRFQLENDSCYWTCGDRMQIYDDEERVWVEGRVEHGESSYYWTNDEYDIALFNGMEGRSMQ